MFFTTCENPFWNIPDDKNGIPDLIISWPSDIKANLWMDHVKNTQSVLRTLSDVPLTSYTNGGTGVFTWDNPEMILGSLGLKTYSMTFTPTDVNYETATNDVEIRVQLVEMVKVNVPVGVAFQMGKHLGTAAGSDITNFHDVTFTRNFSMGKYQVTQEQWLAVMGGTNPSYFHGGTGREPAVGEVQEKRPVETVSWYDAIVLCNRLSVLEGLTPAYEMQTEVNTSVWSTDTATWGAVPTSINTRWSAIRLVAGSTGYRLPTEAQWEYAAKGGQSSLNYSYSGSNDPNLVAWCFGKTGTPTASRTHEVGLLLPNELGIYDMSGNVWEWCWDYYDYYTNTAKTDPQGTTGSNINFRGGSWNSSTENSRSVSRNVINYGNPSGRVNTMGFRLLLP